MTIEALMYLPGMVVTGRLTTRSGRASLCVPQERCRAIVLAMALITGTTITVQVCSCLTS